MHYSSYAQCVIVRTHFGFLLTKLLKRTQQQAGFIYMAEGYFTEAGSLMREGGLDPREVSTAYFSVYYMNHKWYF